VMECRAREMIAIALVTLLRIASSLEIRRGDEIAGTLASLDGVEVPAGSRPAIENETGRFGRFRRQ
jgi:hypothetical protein